MMTDDIPVANVMAMLEVIAAQNPQTRWWAGQSPTIPFNI